MSIETRTFIELKDIAGVEFICPKCFARVYYPLDKQYDRLSGECPNCRENFFVESGFPNQNANAIIDQVRKVMLSLQNVAKSELVKASIRLQVKDLPKE
jgi:hypothetical protein